MVKKSRAVLSAHIGIAATSMRQVQCQPTTNVTVNNKKTILKLPLTKQPLQLPISIKIPVKMTAKSHNYQLSNVVDQMHCS